MKASKLLNGRMTRWLLALQEYNLEIRHISGKQNVIADFLSRATSSATPKQINFSLCALGKYQINPDLSRRLRNIHVFQEQDKNIASIKAKLPISRY